MVIKQIENTETALTEFLESEQAIAVMQHIKDIKLKQKALEDEEKEIRASLENMMGIYGVQSFENDILKVSYKAPTTRESVDSSKLRCEYPDIYEDCKKVSKVKASVVIKVKGE